MRGEQSRLEEEFPVIAKKAKKFLRKAGAVYTQAQPGQAGTDQVMIDTKKSDIRAFDDDGADLL